MKLLPIILFLFLFGCTHTPIKPEKEFVKEYVYIQKDDPNLPLPKPVQLDRVEFLVITPENIDNIWEILSKKSGDKLVLYSFSPEHYKVFAANTEKIFNYIILLQEHNKQITDYYKKE